MSDSTCIVKGLYVYVSYWHKLIYLGSALSAVYNTNHPSMAVLYDIQCQPYNFCYAVPLKYWLLLALIVACQRAPLNDSTILGCQLLSGHVHMTSRFTIFHKPSLFAHTCVGQQLGMKTRKADLDGGGSWYYWLTKSCWDLWFSQSYLHEHWRQQKVDEDK